MRRKRNRFARIGMLSIALLLALCVMGVGYAGWTDTVSIGGTVGMGSIGVVLSQGTCSPPINCSVVAPHILGVTLSNPGAGNYTCGFTITNIGTIPVKIQSIGTSGYPAELVSVSGVAEGMQIEQAGVHQYSFDGKVTVNVLTSCEGAFSFNITFSFVQWNLYE